MGDGVAVASPREASTSHTAQRCRRRGALAGEFARETAQVAEARFEDVLQDPDCGESVDLEVKRLVARVLLHPHEALDPGTLVLFRDLLLGDELREVLLARPVREVDVAGAGCANFNRAAMRSFAASMATVKSGMFERCAVPSRTSPGFVSNLTPFTANTQSRIFWRGITLSWTASACSPASTDVTAIRP